MSIKITIYSDFVCPFCYVGAGIIHTLKNEFDLEDTWIPYELHPDTPAEGKNLTEMVSQFDLDNISGELRRRGAPYGIVFGDMARLANSRLALEAAEFARDHDEYHRMHMSLFKANFTDSLDIGDINTLKSVGEGCGLDPDSLAVALAEGHYTGKVATGTADARKAGVTAIPTFVIEGRPAITGAVNETVFREALQQATNPFPLSPKSK